MSPAAPPPAGAGRADPRAGAGGAVRHWPSPLYGLLLTSLQPEEVIRSRDVQFVPDSLFFEHFRIVLAPGHIVPIREGILNSLAVSLLTAAVCLTVALPAAYALSRFPPAGAQTWCWGR